MVVNLKPATAESHLATQHVDKQKVDVEIAAEGLVLKESAKKTVDVDAVFTDRFVKELYKDGRLIWR